MITLLMLAQKQEKNFGLGMVSLYSPEIALVGAQPLRVEPSAANHLYTARCVSTPWDSTRVTIMF